MEISKEEWMNLIDSFLTRKNINLGKYKFGIFDDDNYEDFYRDTKKVAIISLEEPLTEGGDGFVGAKKIKIHFDEIHFWCVTSHKFRNFRVFDDEWIGFLRTNHPYKEKYSEGVNKLLFKKIKEKYESKILSLNCEIAKSKGDIEKYKSEIRELEEAISNLARAYNISDYKDKTSNKK